MHITLELLRSEPGSPISREEIAACISRCDGVWPISPHTNASWTLALLKDDVLEQSWLKLREGFHSGDYTAFCNLGECVTSAMHRNLMLQKDAPNFTRTRCLACT